MMLLALRSSLRKRDLNTNHACLGQKIIILLKKSNAVFGTLLFVNWWKRFTVEIENFLEKTWRVKNDDIFVEYEFIVMVRYKGA